MACVRFVGIDLLGTGVISIGPILRPDMVFAGVLPRDPAASRTAQLLIT